MNIGIYVTSLTPKSAGQAHFQGALFAGLERINTHRYHFVVFSNEVPRTFQNSETFTYLRIEGDDQWGRATQFIGRQIGRVLLFCCKLLGAEGGRIVNRLTRWTSSEPRYYMQMREFNVRLLWNMNQHELPTCVPFIRTMWEANHRLHPMYPEYSYTRFTFDGLDSNMAYSLARASYVIVGTEEGKRQIIGMFGVHERKIRVIPMPTPVFAIAKERSAPTNKSTRQNPYLFYPARFWPHKNHVVILAALKILRDEWNIRLDCIFSGTDEGNLEYVLQYADKLGVRDQVEYVGLVSDDEMAMLYQAAFALVYASAVGPDNLPPLEAMSLGCPVITAEVPGAREQYGDAAVYFDPINEKELAVRIKELLENTSARDQMVLRGRDRAADRSVESYANAVISILDEFSRIARAWEKNDATFT